MDKRQQGYIFILFILLLPLNLGLSGIINKEILVLYQFDNGMGKLVFHWM